MSSAKPPQTHMARNLKAVQENGWPEGKLYSPKPPSGMSEDEANELLEKFKIDALVQPREERSPMGEQIDAGYRDELDENGGPKVWSPAAHEVPIISEAIQWLRGQRWSTDDLELLAPHFPVEKSALLAADSDPVPGLSIRPADLQALYDQAFENALDRVPGSQFIHWADGRAVHEISLWPVVMGWNFESMAAHLLAKWGSGCFICGLRFSNRARYGCRSPNRVTSGLLVSGGAVAKLFSSCDDCESELLRGTTGLDFIRPRGRRGDR